MSATVSLQRLPCAMMLACGSFRHASEKDQVSHG